MILSVSRSYHRISDSRAVLGPFNIRAGNNVEWNSHQEEEYIDLLALSDKPREELSPGYDIIIVTRTLFPKGASRPEKAMIFLATMCRLSSPAALHAKDGTDEFDADGNKIYKIFPLTCVRQKTQSKTGVFTLEEIFGLETLTAPTDDGDKKDDECSTGDCVICLSDPRYVLSALLNTILMIT